MIKKVLITGGAGYVGSALSDELIDKNYEVTVLDLCIYGKNVFKNASKINLIKGDIRDINLLKKTIPGHDAVIHLACISNDPSFELNPNLGKSINYDAFEPLVEISKKNRVKKFIYASSSSVYGVKSESNVDETLSLEPITDYSKFKAECENILLNYTDKNFQTLIVRPATVCGYAKRLRLDLVVNILTNLAFNTNKIKIFGGEQLRPNINIKDMVEVYIKLINAKENEINGEIFNAGYENLKVKEIAHLVKKNIGDQVELETLETNDNRSYHISSKKLQQKLNFTNKFTIEDAIIELKKAFEMNMVKNPLLDPMYYNIKRMQEISLE